MTLRIYNTLSHKIEKFQEISKGKIGLYTCGPTVYDYAHIGNFRSYVFEDLFKRYLKYLGYQVYHVMNITDIDDKTIRKSHETGQSVKEVVEKYIRAFFFDIETLNILKADIYPRATEHIDDMLEMIRKLKLNGYAYKKGDSVYFSIEKFKNYGRLANILPENLKLGMSVDTDEYDKDNIQDFVLWKGKKEGEPFWKSEFGDGRPGWHIECSAMSMKYLGEHFDIHMGGVDNIFPHHDNEIAQSEGATDKNFVNYWIHVQHLVVENKKMSKSLGNQYVLKDLIDKGYHPMVIRYLLLASHYRKLLNFTYTGLEAARQALNRIKDFVFVLKGLKRIPGSTQRVKDLISQCESKFNENMNDDLNISGALGVFFDFIHRINLNINELKKQDIEDILDFISQLNTVLGILLPDKSDILENEIKEKINQREQARKQKNFRLADAIRDELRSKGIILIDTQDGVRWKIEK